MVPAGQRPDDEARTTPAASPPPDAPTRADALRRIAAEVSGRQDLAGLFEDVLDESFALFGVDRAGLWLYDDRPPPLSLAAQRGLSTGSSRAHRDPPARRADGRHAGPPRAARPRPGRRPRVDRCRTLRDDLPPGRRPDVCYVPLVFGDEPLGLLVLYHRDALRLDRRRDGPGARLRRPHGHGHRQRPAGRIDADAGRPPAVDLRPGRPAEPDPGRRRHRPGDRRARRAASSTTTRSGSTAWTTRRATCEPIAFQGTFLGVSDPDAGDAPGRGSARA